MSKSLLSLIDPKLKTWGFDWMQTIILDKMNPLFMKNGAMALYFYVDKPLALKLPKSSFRI